MAVENTHHTLYHRHLFLARGPLIKLQHRGVGQQPGIKVSARHAASQGVVAGVDVVGAGLERLHRQAPPDQRAHDAGGDGGLTHPAAHSGYYYRRRHYLRSRFWRIMLRVAPRLSVSATKPNKIIAGVSIST